MDDCHQKGDALMVVVVIDGCEVDRSDPFPLSITKYTLKVS